MTEQEEVVLELIAKTHNEFMKLPVQHESDTKDWFDGIHILQRIIMARHARNCFPERFVNIENRK